MKYIEIHKQTKRVHRVEDTLPSNPATAALFIECPDDTVAVDWWLDEATDTLHEEKIWTMEEIKYRRNKELLDSDWMVLEDSKYVTDPANASLLADIKTFRQALRDMPSHAQVLDTTWPYVLWPDVDMNEPGTKAINLPF